MAKRVNIYRCPICQSVVELIDDGGHSLTCCGVPMQLQSLQAKQEVDEFHTPQLTHRNGLLYVKVGSKPHPQSDDHHISFILFVTKQNVRRLDIKRNTPANAVFTDKDHGDVYAYCNVHGLFKTSF